MEPTTDLVVVLPGIMGSTLVRDGVPVWAPSAGGVLRAVRSFGRSVTGMTLTSWPGDGPAGDGVEPGALMPDVHLLPGIWTPVKGYDPLLDRLRRLGWTEERGTLIPFPYDWRLSNRWTAQRVKDEVEPLLDRHRSRGGAYAEARLVFVCHSMGGLVARWYVERLGGAELTRKVITLGTPYRGAAKALEQLVNGVRKGIGPLALDLTAFARSLPSLHQLLPEYACLETGRGPRELSRTTEVDLPELATAHVRDGMDFHTALRKAEEARPASLASTHAIVGFSQPTANTARLDGDRVELLDRYEGQDVYGDGTVPAVSCRADVPMDSPLLRRVPDLHGHLQRNPAALDELEGVLRARDIRVRAPAEVRLRVRLPELVLAGEPVEVEVERVGDGRDAVRVAVQDERGAEVAAVLPRLREGRATALVEDLPPGAYGVAVTGVGHGSRVSPVAGTTLVWG